MLYHKQSLDTKINHIKVDGLRNMFRQSCPDINMYLKTTLKNCSEHFYTVFVILHTEAIPKVVQYMLVTGNRPC